VKVNKTLSSNRQRWIRTPFLANQYRSWLTEKGSLTARLQQNYLDFFVKPVRASYVKPDSEEARLLDVSGNAVAQIREVFLCGSGKPVVFAHSVLPRCSLQGDWRNLGRLGNKPLGAILFANPKVKRTPLTYKKISARHALYHAAMNDMKEKPTYLWARRSVFSLNCASIMVIEVFLPDLIKP
jgi:chorismate--pyruvate lyase